MRFLRAFATGAITAVAGRSSRRLGLGPPAKISAECERDREFETVAPCSCATRLTLKRCDRRVGHLKRERVRRHRNREMNTGAPSDALARVPVRQRRDVAGKCDVSAEADESTAGKCESDVAGFDWIRKRSSSRKDMDDSKFPSDGQLSVYAVCGVVVTNLTPEVDGASFILG